MLFSSRFLLVCFAVFLTNTIANAQLRPRVKITDVKVGFPSGRIGTAKNNVSPAPLVKNGHWAPLTFRLEVLGDTESRLKVVIETYDADEYKTQVSWPLGQLILNPNPQSADDKFRARGTFIEPSEMPTMAYLRTAARAGDTTLRIWTDDPDRASTPVSDTYRLESMRLYDQSVYAVVSLGSNLRGFRLPALPRSQEKDNNNNLLRGGRVETSRYDSVAAMPDQWYGYEGADLVVLSTGNTPKAFLQELFDEQISKPNQAKREALLEWVRRGGKLVVSAGKKGNDLLQMKHFVDFIPAKINSVEQVKDISITTSNDSVRMPKTGETFSILKISPKPERLPIFMMPRRDKISGQIPRNQVDDILVVQSQYGLGRITFFTFDLDDDPIASLSDSRGSMLWDWILRNCGGDKAYEGSSAEKSLGYTNPGFSPTDTEDGEMAGLRTYIDTFDGVPVISFGWVALFILLYTLLIGPIEYIFLKKILGRLELTWITFPIIVISVSAAAYFTAYAVKGKDMKMNKVDVVDIDTASGRMYGNTWFTIFSPRPDSYTLGVEPKDSWGLLPEGSELSPAPSTLIDSMGGNKASQGGGFTRSFREYEYRLDHTDKTGAANGLNGVPIAVWSTKAFGARWSAYLDPASPPVVSTIAHPASNPLRASGTITINLPMKDVAESAFIYRGSFQKVPALPTGTPITFLSPEQDDATTSGSYLRADPWFYSGESNSDYSSKSQYGNNYANANNINTSLGTFSMWGLLFHEAGLIAKNESRGVQNSTLRYLDQSWRVKKDNVEEVILLVRLKQESGPAESILGERNSSSPTKLWLRNKPDAQKPREPVPGTLRQDTYLRFYIPIPKSGK